MASSDNKQYFTGVCGAELLLQVNGEDIEVYIFCKFMYSEHIIVE